MLEITVTGRGGHASMPHDTRDPVPVAAEIVLALQTLVTRRFAASEATVVTITQLEAGSAHNVIPDRVLVKGTIRTLSRERRLEIRTAIDTLAAGIASAHECTAQVTITEGFPVTLNDPRAVALGETVAKELGGADGFHRMADPIMGAEDFSYVLETMPGAMFFLGVADDGADWKHCCGLHSSHMLVDEAVLPKGSAFLAACAVRFLERGWG